MISPSFFLFLAFFLLLCTPLTGLRVRGRLESQVNVLGKVQSESENQVQSAFQSESVSESSSESENQVQSAFQSEAENQGQSKSLTEAENQVQALVQSMAEAKSATESEFESQTESEMMDAGKLSTLGKCQFGLPPYFPLAKACSMLGNSGAMAMSNGGGSPLLIGDLVPCTAGVVCLSGLLSVDSLFKGTAPLQLVVNQAIPGGPVAIVATAKQAFGITLATLIKVGNINAIAGLAQVVLNAIKLQDSAFNVNSIGIHLDPYALSASGSLSLWGVNPLMDVYFVTKPSLIIFSVQFDISILNIVQTKLLNSIFGELAPYFRIFIFTTLTLSYSSDSAKILLPLSVKFNNGVTAVLPGLTIAVSAVFDPASENPLVQILSKITSGGFTASFIWAPTAMTMSLVLPNIIFGSGCSLNSLTLAQKIDYSKVPIALVSTVSGTLTVDVGGASGILQFKASVEVTLVRSNEITITLAMIGNWVNPFGISRLVISNIAASLGIAAIPAPPFVKPTILALAGTATIGSITGSIAFSINLKKPEDSYFQMSAIGFTIGNVLTSFFDLGKWVATFPALVANSGFSKVKFSYATKIVPVVGLAGQVVPAGIYASGKANILGYEGVLEFQFNPNKLLTLLISLDPVVVGGVIISQSATNLKAGPYGAVKITSGTQFVLSLSGYFGCPHFSASVTLMVSQSSVSYTESVNLYGFGYSLTVIISRIRMSFVGTLTDPKFTSALSDHLKTNSQNRFSGDAAALLAKSLDSIVNNFLSGFSLTVAGDLSITKPSFYIEATIKGNKLKATIDISVVKNIFGVILENFVQDTSGLLTSQLANIAKNTASNALNAASNGVNQAGNSVKSVGNSARSIFHF